MSRNSSSICFLIIIFSILSKEDSWGWYSSSSSSSSSSSQSNTESSYSNPKIDLNVAVVKFSIDSPNDQKTMKRLDEARRKMGGLNPCWLRAYANLFSSCSEIFAEEERRRRLAWDLSVCFQRDSGRSPFLSCGEKCSMIDCLQKLNNDEHKIYLEFYLETNSICHQLQIVFLETLFERVVQHPGWDAWRVVHEEQQLTYIEEDCSGGGADLMHRVHG